MMKRILALGALVSIASASMFHAELTSSSPARNSSGPAPSSVSLTFSEPVKLALSRIAILKSDSSLVEKLVIKEKKDAATFGGPITTSLSPGKYLVGWGTVSDDGHAVKGFIPFTVVARR